MMLAGAWIWNISAPCPAPCEQIVYGPDGIGRCHAKVSVVE